MIVVSPPVYYTAASPATSNDWCLFDVFDLFNSDGSQNIFASIEDFLACTEVTWRGTTTILPVQGFGGMQTAGKIAIPQGPIPAVPVGNSNYNWLDMGCNGSQRGNAFTLSHEWRLSGPRGWNAVIY